MKRVALYAGSFDPITNGHLSVIKQGARAFDRVIVAVAVNVKKKPLFSIEERLSLISQSVRHLRNVMVDSYVHKLTIDYAYTKGAKYILRGLRNGRDFEEEHDIQIFNHKHRLDPDIISVFLMADPELTVVSSSAVKEFLTVERGFEIISHYVPKPVLKKLKEKRHE